MELSVVAGLLPAGDLMIIAPLQIIRAVSPF